MKRKARRHLACECGFSLSSDDLDELVEHAQRHARERHGIDFPPAQLAALARPSGGRRRARRDED